MIKESGLTEPGHSVAVDRYLLPGETFNEMCNRVAKAVAAAEGDASSDYETIYTQALQEQRFTCAGRFFTNAGSSNPQFPNCFIDAIYDSKESIWGTLQKFAVTLSGGGGQGASFSRLRSRGLPTTTSRGTASGPVSFIKLYDASGEVIVQGGSRRAAHMGVLDVDHPDILEFLMLKDSSSKLRRFNISVGVYDDFAQQCFSEGSDKIIHICYEPHLKKFCRISIPGLEDYSTVESRSEYIQAHYMERVITDNFFTTDLTTNLPLKNFNPDSLVSVADVFYLMCYKAWQCGDPGVLFLDKINATNPFLTKDIRPTKSLRDDPFYFRASNPCAEEQMADGEICMLGHIILPKFVRGLSERPPKQCIEETTEDEEDAYYTACNAIEWELLESTVATLVRFLDDAIDVSSYPSSVNEETAKATRRIGCGTLGWADFFILLGVTYGSPLALELANKVGEFIQKTAERESYKLGEEKGNFPLFELCKSNGYFEGLSYRRNSILTTMAPTGTTSMLAGIFTPGEGVSSSGEPNFAFHYIRKDEVHPEGVNIFHPLVNQYWKLNNVEDADKDLKLLPSFFVTAPEISYTDHIKMLDVFQTHVDSGISKTNNMPSTATVEDVAKAFQQAYYSSVKSFTVYRDKSKETQVLNNIEPESPSLSTIKGLLNRPFILKGRTLKATTGHGTLFVTINEDSLGPCEVFLNIGRQGSDISVFAEAIGRLISKGLQTFFSVQDRRNYLQIVVHQFANLQGPYSGFDGTLQATVKSIPDAVSKLLTVYLDLESAESKIEEVLDEASFVQQQYCATGNC